MDSDPILFLNYFAQIDNMFVVAIIILLLLLLASALISGTEVAFFSLSKTDIINISEETKDHNPVVELLQKPRKLLATILITNNFLNILIVLIFASLGEAFFKNQDLTLKLLDFHR